MNADRVVCPDCGDALMDCVNCGIAHCGCRITPGKHDGEGGA